MKVNPGKLALSLSLTMWIVGLVGVGCLSGCKPRNAGGFAAGTGQGIAKAQSDITSAKWNVTHARPHSDGTGKVLLDSATSNLDSGQDALGEAQVQLAKAELANFLTEQKLTKVQTAYDDELKRFFSHKQRVWSAWIIGIIVGAWALIGTAGVVLGAMGDWTWSARLLRFIPFSNPFAMIRKRVTGVDMREAATAQQLKVNT